MTRKKNRAVRIHEHGVQNLRIQHEELLEKYSKALKDALKYASICQRQKRIHHEYVDYFNDLRRATMNQAEIYVDDEKFPKGKSY